MPTPTEKPIDQVTVSLSDGDFCRLVGNVLTEEIFRTDLKGRIEVKEIGEQRTTGSHGWIINCAFIQAEDV